MSREEFLQMFSTCDQWTIDERLAIFDKQIERDKHRRRLLGKPADATLGRVNALEQRIERKPLGRWNDDLAVEDDAISLEF